MKKKFFNKAENIGMKSAVVGSFIFSTIECLHYLYVNGFLPENLPDALFMFTLFLIFSILLSIGFGYVGAHLLERYKIKRQSKKGKLTLVGGIFGVISVFTISLLDLFVVLSAHDYWSIQNNPMFPVYLYRLGIVSMIALLMGGFSGYKIHEL